MNKRMMEYKAIITGAMLSLSAFAANSLQAVDLYVSPAGSDAFVGTTQAKSVASLAKARDLARPYAGKQAVTVHVADGLYYLPETLTFASQDSGTATHPIVYRADNEGGAVLSGGSKLELDWTAYQDGIFQAKTPSGLEIDQLFIDGKAQRMARYPNYDPKKKTAAYQGFSADAFSKKRAANWADPTGGYIHAMHVQRWGGYHYRITGKDAKGEVTYEGGWQNNRQMGMHKDFRMVENIFEELDAAGEWFHNAKTSTLYYMPAAGVDMAKAAADQVYEAAGIGPEDIQVVELHDCFTANELLTYEALGLTAEGTAEKFIWDGDNTYGGRVVTNPSGGLLSKGHPLGATGLAQCTELVWQLRGDAGPRQVSGARHGLQHNLGLGGACVVTLYSAD